MAGGGNPLILAGCVHCSTSIVAVPVSSHRHILLHIIDYGAPVTTRFRASTLTVWLLLDSIGMSGRSLALYSGRFQGD